ncbi:hypothetical protein BIW53_15740 [Pseudoalteromonas byunsanensis]|uniref:Uncharacterized protein n=1 Tax=Pseudoalteromonas byunsanensis TaxID=327939 RepID=A0A1S1N4D3_9GAMM|nr:hypothetical protein BIW53_15740 [Pseudoalteromonas byunsanensis]
MLAVASALFLCGWLLVLAPLDSSELRGNTFVVDTAVFQLEGKAQKSQAQPRALSQAQQFLHVYQSMPQAILLFVFALLCVSCIAYLPRLFLSLIPWYCRCQSLAKLRFSLWRNNNILKRHTSHSLSL